MVRAEAELTQRLRSLYAAAGSPELASVVRWAAQQRPPVWVSVSGLADWLRPDRVAIPGEGALLAVVRHLAGTRFPQDLDRWRAVRRAAWVEAHPGVLPAA